MYINTSICKCTFDRKTFHFICDSHGHEIDQILFLFIKIYFYLLFTMLK